VETYHHQYKQEYVLLYSSIWVIPRDLNFMCWHFRTLCQFHLHMWCKQEDSLHHLWRWDWQHVLKRWRIKFRRWGTTQKKEYDIQNTAEVLNEEECVLLILFANICGVQKSKYLFYMKWRIFVQVWNIYTY